MDIEEVNRRFTKRQNHPNPDVNSLLEIIWGQFRLMAIKIIEIVPPGREQSLAITSLEESLFWAQAQIERTYR